MSARDDYQAAEQRLVEVEAQIEALQEWRQRNEAWSVGITRRTPPPHPGGDLAELLLERERLQERSHRAHQRTLAEAG